MGSEWKEMPFSEAVLVNPPIRLEKGQTYPFVDMNAIDPLWRRVSESEFRAYKSGGARFKPGDTLMARITPCLENGKIAQYWPERGGMGSAFGSTEFIVIRGREGVTDNNFAYYLTKWQDFRRFAISQMTGSSGRQRVPTSALEHFSVPVPPLPEQRAIAHILGTLDDKIELNRRMNATLEAMARALFKSWFVDFDPVWENIRRHGPGHPLAGQAAAHPGAPSLPEEILALFPDAFEESALGLIPQGWRVMALDEIATYLNGLACQKYPPQPGESSLPVIKIREMRQGITANTDRATSKVPSEYIVEDGDVLFSWSGSLLVDIWCNGQGVLNQHLFKVTSRNYPKWFYFHWTAHHLEEFQRIAADKATTMGHIRRHHLSEAKVLVPEPELLGQMSEFFEPLLEQRIQNNLESRTLAGLRDTLLPRLISGELRVEDAERFLAEAGV